MDRAGTEDNIIVLTDLIEKGPSIGDATDCTGTPGAVSPLVLGMLPGVIRQVGEMSEELNRIQERLIAISNRLGKLESAGCASMREIPSEGEDHIPMLIAELNSRLECAMSEVSTSIDDLHAGVEDALAKQEARICLLEAAPPSPADTPLQDEEKTGVSEKGDALEALVLRIDACEERCTEITDTVTRAAEETKAAVDKAADCTVESAGLSSRIQDMEREFTGFAERLASCEEENSTIASRLESEHTGVCGLSEKISLCEGLVAGLSEKLIAVSEESASSLMGFEESLRQACGKLEETTRQKALECTDAIASLSTRHDQLGERIENVDVRLGEIVAQSKENAEALKAFEKALLQADEQANAAAERQARDNADLSARNDELSTLLDEVAVQSGECAASLTRIEESLLHFREQTEESVRQKAQENAASLAEMSTRQDGQEALVARIDTRLAALAAACGESDAALQSLQEELRRTCDATATLAERSAGECTASLAIFSSKNDTLNARLAELDSRLSELAASVAERHSAEVHLSERIASVHALLDGPEMDNRIATACARIIREEIRTLVASLSEEG